MKRKRTRRRWLTNPALLLATFLVFAATAWITAPAWSAGETISHDSFPIRDAIQYRTAAAFTAAWLFFFGASVGSFLNVVVWRLPRGESLVWQSSRCPRCGVGIRPSDNLPVFGWLKLRGRCRNCRTPISLRYPLVELAAGLIFLGLAVPELFLRGVNLPNVPAPHFSRSMLMIFEIHWQLIAIYAYHCFLAAFLLTWSLIERDRQRMPSGVFVLTVTAAVLAPLVVAAFTWQAGADSISTIAARPLHPQPFTEDPPRWIWERGWWNLPLDPLLGLAAGAICGWLLLPAASGVSHPPPLAAMLAVVGVFLGWQAVLSASLLAAVLLLAAAARSARFADRWMGGSVLAAALVQLLFWRILDQSSFWPGSRAAWTGIFAWTMLLALCAMSAGRVLDARRRRADL